MNESFKFPALHTALIRLCLLQLKCKKEWFSAAAGMYIDKVTRTNLCKSAWIHINIDILFASLHPHLIDLMVSINDTQNIG